MARSKKPQPKPAFPQAQALEAVVNQVGGHSGLTNRDFFAGCSLIGIRAAGHEMDAQMAARMAFVDADAMLAEGVQP